MVFFQLTEHQKITLQIACLNVLLSNELTLLQQYAQDQVMGNIRMLKKKQDESHSLKITTIKEQ